MREYDEYNENLNKKNKSEIKNKTKETKKLIKDILESSWEKLLLSDKEISYVLKNPETRYFFKIDSNLKQTQIEILHYISNIMKNLEKSKIKDFLKRKNKYLEKHRTISKERFEELFWWSWKFWKTEINQRTLWICYAYAWFELLKKTNWFDEIIQTNLIETENWWKIRLPFCDENWEWIPVNKNEIDKVFYNKKLNRAIKINSESEYLWFKILEIAFIKKEILNKFIWWDHKSQTLKNAYFKYLDTNDIPLNVTLLHKIEWWATPNMLKSILPKKTLIFKHLSKWTDSKIKDFAFDHFSTWLYKISLYMHWKMDKNIFWTNLMKWLDKDGNILSVAIKDSKIIDTWKIETKSCYIECDNWINLIPNPSFWTDFESQRATDLITNQKWNKYAMIFPDHAYLIEKCYTTSNWEKRVWIVNPHHTWIKIDISLDECDKIFDRDITWIDIDKMFR